MSYQHNNIIFGILLTTAVILLLSGFIITLLVLYKRKQLNYQQKIYAMKTDHEKLLLSTRLEIQETTFQHIACEIHDNINLSLTLAKLHLNTFSWDDKEKADFKLATSIDLLSQTISDLSDMSRSFNSTIIQQQGLIRALEDEITRIAQTGIMEISLAITGEPVYMDTGRELVVFRIIQEAMNNTIRHSHGSHAEINLYYTREHLHISICDNGIGFEKQQRGNSKRSGLKNMELRAKLIGGSMCVESRKMLGTSLSFIIPL